VSGKLLAYIDESGQRGRKGSRHFILSALIVRDTKEHAALDLLSELKQKLNRKPGDVLHWQKYTGHGLRLTAAQAVAQPNLFRVVSVVVCKDHLEAGSHMNDDHAYMFTFRFLLERLSWFAREYDAELEYTLGHVVRFPMSKLREYEARLRESQSRIAWSHLSPSGGRIDQPKRVPMLQLADIPASAIGAAFNPCERGFTETRYLTEFIRKILYVRNGGALTTYGLKMHPWNESTKAAYPWVAAL